MATTMMRMYDRNEGEYVSDLEFFDWIRAHRRPDGMAQPVVYWGAAGIGKTERVRAYAQQRELAFKEYLPAHDTTGENLSGIRIVENGRTRRALPDWLPQESDGPSVLFIDEVNRAPQSVQDGLLELIGSGTLSAAGYRLPTDASIVAAANPADLEHAVHDIDNAMIDRFLHVAPGWDAAPWAAWADTVPELHASAVDFALANPRLIAMGEVGFPLALQSRIDATPRSLTNLGFLVTDEIPDRLLRLFALGLLGPAKYEDYIAWFKGYLCGQRPLRFDDLLKGGYDQTIAGWGSGPEADWLTEATNERIVAVLMTREVNDDLALVVGRYMALIHDGLREQLLESAARSAALWVTPLMESCKRWLQRLDRR
jgi:hypothetical protein